MVNQTEIWKQTLYKVLEDAEIMQTIVIFEDDAAAFRVVQLYDLKRYKNVKTNGIRPPGATYCRGSVFASREIAMVEAQRLVAKHLVDHWRIWPDEQTAEQASGRSCGT